MSASDVFRITYLLALLGSCGYAFWAGGRPERQGAAIMLVGSVLSVPAATTFDRSWHWDPMKYGILTVDLGVLAAFLILALRSDRFWPLWTTAFHLIGVLTHFATLATPSIVRRAYSLAQPFWAYPMLIALVVGAIAHRRAAHRRRASIY